MNALALELSGDPESIGYSVSPYDHVADVGKLNAKTRRAPIVPIDVRRYLRVVGKMVEIEDAAVNSVSDSTRKSAMNFVNALAEFDEGFGYNPAEAGTAGTVSKAISDALDALITTGLIDAANKTAVLALGENKRSRGQELGLGTVTVGQVMRARG